ncbi:MAG: DUF4126 domain-containing protein [Cyanobacteria bacterium P01_F01_bin.150]
MIELLAVLSLAAAAGLRTAMPLLLIGLIHGDLLWSHVPVLSAFHPQILSGFLVSWSLLELILPKWLLGQRVLQRIQLLLSPLVGAIASLTVVYLSQNSPTPSWLLGVIGALLALVLQLVQVGWFYRLRGIPVWGTCLQDILCFILVLLAFDAPHEGGLLALTLLWLAIRSSALWQKQRNSPYFQADRQPYTSRSKPIEMTNQPPSVEQTP